MWVLLGCTILPRVDRTSPAYLPHTQLIKGMEDQFKGSGSIIVTMHEEQQKRTKLFSVMSGLSSIKEQLQQLMPPKSDERTNDTNLPLQNPTVKQSIRTKVSPQRPERTLFRSPTEKMGMKVGSRSQEKGVLAFQPKSRPSKQPPSRNDLQMGHNEPKSSISHKKNPVSFIKSDPRAKPGERLKFLPKNQREKNNNIFVDIVNRAANEEEWMSPNQKIFSHCRHSSQKELYVGKKINSHLTHTLEVQRQYQKQVNHKKQAFFQFKNTAKQRVAKPLQEGRKLQRMKSDLIDHSEPFRYSIAENVEMEGYSTSRLDLAERIKQLQQENYQKQGIIHILEAELAEIQASFTLMKHSIARILRIGGSSVNNLDQIDLNEQLAQIIKDLQLQRDESKRVLIDCELWKQKSIQQALKVKDYQSSLESYSRMTLAFDELREQNCRIKDQLANITSKLQVSVNQNSIKDEFIVKFMVARGAYARQDDKISQIIDAFQEYFKTIAYPNNRLLQKLNEQQQEIRRLHQIIQHLQQ